MNTYNIIGSMFGALLIALPIAADNTQQAYKNLKIQNKAIRKVGNQVKVAMDLNLDQIQLASNKGLIYTPIILNEKDTLFMPSVEVMGKKRYIYYQRNQKTATANPLIVALRKNKTAQTLHYEYAAPFSDWMKNSNFAISNDACGCNQQLLDEGILNPEGRAFSTPKNLFNAYVQPKAEAVKARKENGSARLNFKVNKWDILYDMGNNANELDNIRKTLDLVKNDSDVTITKITLHGYASPDGGYANNNKLSHNRTQALLKHILKIYPISSKLFAATATAEDWAGTIKYVNENDIPQKEAALEIINSNMQPDAKEKALLKKAPQAYHYLLQNVWPSLRRTDYTIEYDVQAFNVEKAREVIKTRPQKLSLQEMYLVAQTYPKGSAEFNNVFDIAVRMFPEDKLANLNAASAAIERGDKVSAEKYLLKAGDSAEANNARGCLAAMKEDYQTAKQYFEKAVAAGLKEAQENLDKINQAL